MALFTIATSAHSMSYEQARAQALFLTDKMAYELNLTEEQYEAAFEINLDYLMSISNADDLYGAYWRHRNLDLSYILLDWQYRSFIEASYFYRPLCWDAGYWRLSIYSRYPRRDYYYFSRPRVYAVYRGGRSWYNGRRYVTYNDRERYFGMRDSYQRGYYEQDEEFRQPTREKLWWQQKLWLQRRSKKKFYTNNRISRCKPIWKQHRFQHVWRQSQL